MRKYAVVPAYVHSKNDMDRHYIAFLDLCMLYGVNPAECIDCSRVLGGAEPERFNLPILRPRYDGNYSLPNTTDSKVGASPRPTAALEKGDGK